LSPNPDNQADTVPDGVVRLLQALAMAQEHGPSELADWLDVGLDAYLSGADPAKAFGLRGGKGQRSGRTYYLTFKRNQFLREAHRLVTYADILPWPRSALLAEEVKRFRELIWPKWKGQQKPPANSSQLSQSLFYAFQCGLEVPESQGHLHDLVTTR